MKQTLLIWGASAILASATAVQAQTGDARATSDDRVEVTPFGFVGSNSFEGLGGAVRWPLPAPHLSLELESSVRHSAVAPFSASVNLLYDLPTIARATPYLAAGVGLDQYGFADTSLSGAVVTQADTALAINAGGGVRVRANDQWGVRTDARWSNGLGRAPETWRLYNGVTYRGKAR